MGAREEWRGDLCRSDLAGVLPHLSAEARIDRPHRDTIKVFYARDGEWVEDERPMRIRAYLARAQFVGYPGRSAAARGAQASPGASDLERQVERIVPADPSAALSGLDEAFMAGFDLVMAGSGRPGGRYCRAACATPISGCLAGWRGDRRGARWPGRDRRPTRSEVVRNAGASAGAQTRLQRRQGLAGGG